MQPEKTRKKKILFFGLGSIGRKHAKIIKNSYNYEIIAFRTKKGQEQNNLKIPEIYNLQEAFQTNPEIAFITNPTYLHMETALECAKRNIHLFIEKPISHNLTNVLELEKEIKKRNLITYIAYNLRFHPIIEKIKEITSNELPITYNVKSSSYMPDWRPNQDYSKSYSAKMEMGGGVTLDLSHEFDYITWFFGNIEKIEGYCDKVSYLEINSEDILEAEVTCETGIKGKIHLDYFTKNPERKIQIKYKDGIIEADLIKNTIKDKHGKISEFKCEKDETYKKQIDYFFKNYNKKNTNMMNNYSEGLKTFKKIIEFKNKNCKI